MATPTIVAGHTTVQDTSATTSRDIAAPTHSSDDLILVFASGSVATNSNIAISGFTPAYDNVTTGSVVAVSVLYKRTGGSEPANYAITSASMVISALAVAVRDARSFHAIGTNATGSSATATAPALTTVVSNTLRISVVAADDNPGITSVATLSGHTPLGTVTGSGKPTVSVQHKTLASSGTDAAQTAALSGSEQWIGLSFALSDTAEERVTQTGALVEFSRGMSAVTQAGLYVEIYQQRINLTQAGIYVEIIESQKVRATALAAYIELAPAGANDYVRATALSAYVELISATPATPTLLTAVAVSDSQINLAWVDNATGETSYRVERSLDGVSGWAVIAALVANSTSYANTGLNYSTTYYYRVATLAYTVQSAYSNIASATTLAPEPALSGLSINVNQLTAELFDRNDEPSPLPYGLRLTVQRYDALAAGGYNYAELEVSGYSEALWTAAQWLGYYVRIRDHNHSVVWVGMVEELILSLGAVEMGLSLKEMANRVAVAYSTTVVTAERGTTPWADHEESVARYGAKELLYTMSDATLAQAETQRDTLLATLARPVPTVRINPGGATNRATLHCTGLIKTLGWCNYAQPVGLEEHSPTGGGQAQAVGQGLTATNIGFANDGQIADLGGRLNAVESGHTVQVSGSSSNNGAYLVEDTPGDEGKSYTATTISFDPLDDIRDVTNEGLGLATVNDYIEVSGSSSNDGIYRVKTAEADHLAVSPGGIVNESAGASVTISRGNAIKTNGALTHEAPGATVTLTVHGQKVAQSFSLGYNASWTVDQVVLRMYKVGAPGDSAKVELCADSSGSPGTVLASGTVAAANIGERIAEITFDLGNTQTINYGTTYWLVVSRTGANDIDDFYMVEVDEALGYSRGSLKLYTGAAWSTRATDADLIFRVMGATPTTTQISEIVNSDCGQFLAGVDLVDASGVEAWQYRAGDNNGFDELEKLLDLGTSSGQRLLATVTPERILRIRVQPGSGQDNLLLSSDGRLRDAGNRLYPYGGLPAGKWLRLADVPGNVDALAALANVFVERAEFDAGSGKLTMEAQGEAKPWRNRLTPQEIARQAAALKPFVVGW